MEETKEISKKELLRRKRISRARKKAIEKKRRDGYKRWLKKMRAEKGLKKAADGTYKKKRKVGRPKKRGPKKKRKSRAKKPVDGRTINTEYKRFNFKIVSCVNSVQKGHIAAFRNAIQAYERFNQLKEESKLVKFPRTTVIHGEPKEIVYEYLILEKNRDGSKSNSILKNKLGIYTEQELNTDKWVLVDKCFYNIEETFWVYGFDPTTERKTYQWIFDNVLLYGIDGKYDIKRIIVYKNKILFKCDDGYYDMILCKTESDAVKFYNLLMSDIKEKKLNKQFIFMGSYSEISDRRRELEADLMKQTGWAKYKIQRKTT